MLKTTNKIQYRAKLLVAISLIFVSIFISVFAIIQKAFAQRAVLEPPLVTLYNKEVSNDEIFYIGGRVTVPESTVIVYIQSEDGSILSREVKTDAQGIWFYSHPEFLSKGRYTIWTQLKSGELLSPPSPQINIDVITTAIQIGKRRLSYEGMYGLTALALLLLVLALAVFNIWHFKEHHKKSKRLAKEIAEAENSVKRGFAVLKRDIMAELEIIRKAKKPEEFTQEEKDRENKLLKDLELVESYIGKEIYDIEEVEH
ncbi:MAG: hypothetical protein ACK4NX_02955 [Candidatus Paceibacteria bacterium]